MVLIRNVDADAFRVVLVRPERYSGAVQRSADSGDHEAVDDRPSPKLHIVHTGPPPNRR
jgi:hypothetical protein